MRAPIGDISQINIRNAAKYVMLITLCVLYIDGIFSGDIKDDGWGK